MEYDNTNKGAMWSADKASPKHPDYTGSINIDGNDYFISAWKNNSDNIKAPVLQLSVKLKESTDQIPF